MDFENRHCISRARFFIGKAEACQVSEKNDFEAYLEATIIFARAALNRVSSMYKANPEWNEWFNNFKKNPSVNFIKAERDYILKDAPPKIHQNLSGNKIELAKFLYYYEDYRIPASDTLKKHVDEISSIISEANFKFESRLKPNSLTILKQIPTQNQKKAAPDERS